MSPLMLNTGPEISQLASAHTTRAHVAVAVIERKNIYHQREILIAKRPDHVHQGGLWEFPGGKVEPGESVTSALSRELYEELDIIPSCYQPLIQIEHQYDDKLVFLDVWSVSEFEGNARGKEGQTTQWVNVDMLTQFDFPAANLAIIKACRLPRQYVITPEYRSFDEAKKNFRLLLDQGHPLILLRQPQLDVAEYQKYTEHLLACYPELPEKLLLSGDPVYLGGKEFNGVRVKGIQAPFRLVKTLLRRPLPLNQYFGVSCHNEEEMKFAEDIEADFITLSPVEQTSSHPNAVPIGWDNFQRWVRSSKLPVYALGGMKVNDSHHAFESGAQGIAGISLWQPAKKAAK